MFPTRSLYIFGPNYSFARFNATLRAGSEQTDMKLSKKIHVEYVLPVIKN